MSNEYVMNSVFGIYVGYDRYVSAQQKEGKEPVSFVKYALGQY